MTSRGGHRLHPQGGASQAHHPDPAPQLSFSRIVQGQMHSNLFWCFVAFGVQGTSQWALVLLLARYGTPEMLGLFTLAFAISTPLQVMIAQLQSLLSTDAAFKFSTQSYFVLGSSLSILVAVTVPSAMIVVGAGLPIVEAVFLIASAKAVENVGGLIYAVLQRQDRWKLIASSMIVRGGASVLSFGALLVATKHLLPALAGMVVAWLLCLFILDIGWLLRRYSVPDPYSRRLSWKEIRTLVHEAWPLSITAVLISLYSHFPRYYVQMMLGLRSLGYYGALSYTLTAGDLAGAIFGRASTSQIAAAKVRGVSVRPALMRLCHIALATVGPAAVLGILFSRRLLGWLYGIGYDTHVEAFRWLIIGAIITGLAQFLSYALTANRILKGQMFLSVANIVISIIALSILVPRLGMLGVALSINLVAAFRVVVSFFLWSQAIAKSSSL
jgi:O-antigen/teichoic acid export membrane protein